MSNAARKVSSSTKRRILMQQPLLIKLLLLMTLVPVLIVLLIWVIAFLSLSDFSPTEYEQIKKEGRTTKARITKIWEQENVTLDNVHPVIIYYAYPENGVDVETRYRTLSVVEAERLKAGDTITVQVLRKKSIIPSFQPVIFSYSPPFVLPIPFLLAATGIFSYLLIQYRKVLRLYEYGSITKGRILSMTQKPILPLLPIGRGIMLLYEYKTTEGQTFVGRHFTTDLSILQEKKQGDVMAIFVSPDNERESCIIPTQELLMNNWNIA